MLTIGDDVELSGSAADDHGGRPHTLPCPFARHGLDSSGMSTCPGYQGVALSFAGIGAGESLGERVTCAHLGTQRGTRGFVSACTHPGGMPPSAPELARRAERAARRNARSLTT